MSHVIITRAYARPCHSERLSFTITILLHLPYYHYKKCVGSGGVCVWCGGGVLQERCGTTKSAKGQAGKARV